MVQLYISSCTQEQDTSPVPLNILNITCCPENGQRISIRIKKLNIICNQRNICCHQSVCLRDWLESIDARFFFVTVRKSSNEHKEHGRLIRFVLHRKEFWANHSRKKSQRHKQQDYNLIKLKKIRAEVIIQ